MSAPKGEAATGENIGGSGGYAIGDSGTTCTASVSSKAASNRESHGPKRGMKVATVAGVLLIPKDTRVECEPSTSARSRVGTTKDTTSGVELPGW